jgi:putative FMN-dependent luciferase-like monooxygenase
MSSKRLGFFTRLLDNGSAQERYRLATEQIVHAERAGFDTAWVAQHHFHQDEGGLPSPLVFLAQAAVHTRHIRLGTGVITLPMESVIRVAEDTAVLDLLSGGRLEVGLAAGGTPSSFGAFGIDAAQRNAVFSEKLHTLLAAWGGEALGNTDNYLYPVAPQLTKRVWQATFSVEGGIRAGRAGDGLMLSRTQPRPEDAPDMPLDELQNPIIDAYLAALPPGVEPRIMGSRTAFVTEEKNRARDFAAQGLSHGLARLRASGHQLRDESLDGLIRAFDVHLGTPEQVIASLQQDSALARVTDLAFQVHSIDPPHAYILRSIELIARDVAPALGWRRRTPAGIVYSHPVEEKL